MLWDGYSLEADCGKTTENTIIFLYKGGKDDASLQPGGQTWCFNKDGTISITKQVSRHAKVNV